MSNVDEIRKQPCKRPRVWLGLGRRFPLVIPECAGVCSRVPKSAWRTDSSPPLTPPPNPTDSQPVGGCASACPCLSALGCLRGLLWCSFRSRSPKAWSLFFGRTSAANQPFLVGRFFALFCSLLASDSTSKHTACQLPDCPTKASLICFCVAGGSSPCPAAPVSSPPCALCAPWAPLDYDWRRLDALQPAIPPSTSIAHAASARLVFGALPPLDLVPTAPPLGANLAGQNAVAPPIPPTRPVESHLAAARPEPRLGCCCATRAPAQHSGCLTAPTAPTAPQFAPTLSNRLAAAADIAPHRPCGVTRL